MSELEIVKKNEISVGFTPEQQEMLRVICKDFDKLPLARIRLFELECQKLGLDPFSRQIYLIVRKSQDQHVGTTQTSIDGFRLIASRTGEYVGSDEAWSYDKDGGLVSSTVTVYRLVSGQRCAFSATAHYDEYVQEYNGKPSGLWAKMPHRMIAKCAESLALRKAFPNELGSLYTTEEYPEDPHVQSVQQNTLKPVAKPAQIAAASGDIEKYVSAIASAETIAEATAIMNDARVTIGSAGMQPIFAAYTARKARKEA